MKHLYNSYFLKFSIIALLFGLSFIGFGQKTSIESGPMLGPITLRDATIWLQTNRAANVQIVYWEKQNKSQKKIKSQLLYTEPWKEFVAVFHLSQLKTGTTYEYEVYVNNTQQFFKYPLEFTTQTHWQYRTQAPDFSFTFGSCFYVNEPDYDRPGKPYGDEYSILYQMAKVKPEFNVWLGDNIYLREGDFESKSGIFHRNKHTRSFGPLQPLLAAMPHYAIWDDHDYGPNDSDWTYGLKHFARDAFMLYWPSESYGAGHTEGITNHFKWNDCEFFMLDDRWYRTVDRENGTILGDLQKYWLKEALLASNATFKFVCVGGQFLNTAKVFENFSNYQDERQEIIDFIDQNKIEGVVFLTGDRHHSEISRLQTDNNIVIYDLTSSALTSGTGLHDEPNTLRIDGSMIGVRNFAQLYVSGDKKNRNLKVVYRNSIGVVLFEHALNFKRLN